jgi:hypothetical protein
MQCSRNDGKWCFCFDGGDDDGRHDVGWWLRVSPRVRDWVVPCALSKQSPIINPSLSLSLSLIVFASQQGVPMAPSAILAVWVPFSMWYARELGPLWDASWWLLLYLPFCNYLLILSLTSHAFPLPFLFNSVIVGVVRIDSGCAFKNIQEILGVNWCEIKQKISIQ